MASSSPCHGARRPRSANPPTQVGIWVTDLMLQQAVARFQRRTLITSRSIGTHKMLQTHRRPVGKRQLTKAMPSSVHQPLWWFELMGDKKAWRWEAPTSVQERRYNEQQLSWKGAIDKIVAWLEASDLDKPFLAPPVDATGEAITTAETSPETLAAFIQTFEETIATSSAQGHDALATAAADCCQALEYRLLSAQFTAPEIQSALTALMNSAQSHPASDLLAELRQRLLGTIIKSVCALCPAKVDVPLAELYKRSVSTVLQAVYAAPRHLHEYMVSHLMENLQDHETFVSPIIANIVEDIVAEYTRKYVGVEKHEAIKADSISQLAQLSDMLLQLPERIRQGIAEHMKGIILSAGTARCNAFVWFFIATRSELLSEANVDAVVTHFKSLGGYLTTTETVLLAMERLVQRGLLDKEQWQVNLGRMEDIMYPPFFWVVLFDGLERGSEYANALRDTLVWLRRWGYKSHLGKGLVTAQMSFCHPQLTEPARNIMLALLTVDGSRRFQYAFYKTLERYASYAHVRRQLQDPEADISQDVNWRRAPEVIEAMAAFYLESDSLSDRQAQLGVGWCLAQTELLSEDAVGSDQVLQAFVKTIVKRMEAGNPIPQARRDYLVTKIRQYLGPEQAARVEEQLSEWSRSIAVHSRLKRYPDRRQSWPAYEQETM